MSEFRISLGRKRDPTNLVTNGTFPVDLSGWVAGAGWIHNAGGTAEKTVGAESFLTQTGIFTLGRTYSVDFEVVAGSTMGMFIGEYGFTQHGVGTFTQERVCLRGTDLQFRAETGQLDNVAAFELIFNDPIEDEPIGLKEIVTAIERDRTLDALFRESTSQITFFGDGFDSIFAEFEANGLCTEIPALVEIECSDGDGFETLFEGVIFLSDVEFDLGNNLVKATIEDVGVGQVLKNKRAVEIALNVNDLTFSRDYLVDPRVSIDFHDRAGAYVGDSPFNDKTMLNVAETFRRIIHEISGVNIEFESDFFTSGTYEFLTIQWGKVIRDALSNLDKEIAVLSFDKLFGEMNKVFNLAVQITFPSGVPTIKVEPKVNFEGVASSITLDNVPNLKFTFDIERIYKTVSIGYEKVEGQDQDTIKGVQYISVDECTQNNLELVSDMVQDSAIIFDILEPPNSDENRISNGQFTADEEWIKGAGWTISGGTATHAAGSVSAIAQFGVLQKDIAGCDFAGGGCRFTIIFEVSGRTAGSITPNMAGTAGDAVTTNGSFSQTFIPGVGDDESGFTNNAAFDGSIDNIAVRLNQASTSFDDDLFIIETNGTRTKQTGGGNVYNATIDFDDNMTRWVVTLQDTFENIRDTTDTITKVNAPLIRVWEFEFPMSKADFDLIADDTNKITFNSTQCQLEDTEGFILFVERSNADGMTTFRLLSE